MQLQQRQGLPIGGHLSAAFIELVALRRVCQCSWPPMLMNVPTARYRGNVFVVLSDEPSVAERLATARMLSDLPMMPVGFKRGGRVARCLELRINWSNACKVKAVLAYRTDGDRQGESGDVRTWPEWRDPRAPAVLHALLVGLPAKLLNYADPSVGGFTASLRQAVRFLHQRAISRSGGCGLSRLSCRAWECRTARCHERCARRCVQRKDWPKAERRRKTV